MFQAWKKSGNGEREKVLSFTFKAATSALEVILFRFGQVFFSLTRMFAAHHEKSFFPAFLRSLLIIWARFLERW